MLKSDFLGQVFAFVVDLAGVTQLTFVIVSETSFFTTFKQCIKKFFIMGYSRKNQTGGLRTRNSQGYSRKSMWKLQGSNKKEVEFPGAIKKKSCGISIRFGFWPWNFQVVQHNFAEFPGVKFCFVSTIQGQSDKPKDSKGFFKKEYPQASCLDVFQNSLMWLTYFRYRFESSVESSTLTIFYRNISFTRKLTVVNGRLF